jgi:hypothetical protein
MKSVKRLAALAMAFVFATQVSAAERARPEAAAAEGSGSRRGAPFWTGVGLLAGGLGLAAFAATRTHHCDTAWARAAPWWRPRTA